MAAASTKTCNGTAYAAAMTTAAATEEEEYDGQRRWVRWRWRGVQQSQ
jgi:hypothetical protein